MAKQRKKKPPTGLAPRFTTERPLHRESMATVYAVANEAAALRSGKRDGRNVNGGVWVEPPSQMPARLVAPPEPQRVSNWGKPKTALQRLLKPSR